MCCTLLHESLTKWRTLYKQVTFCHVCHNNQSVETVSDTFLLRFLNFWSNIRNHFRLKMKRRILFPCICIFLFAIRENVAQSLTCNALEDTAAIKQVLLKVYKGSSSDYTYTQTTVTNPRAIASDIIPDRDTVLYIHGFTDYPEKETVAVVIRAYLERGDVNLIVTDWSNIASNYNYVYVSQNVPGVGKAVGQAMNELADVINFSTFHVAGHSLGAHVGSHVSRNLNTTLNRLTGLDPAFPLFYPSDCHINPTDAEIVVALHTDAGVSGTPFKTASVDFYANNGIHPQPGCTVLLGTGNKCSHQRSVFYYAESLTNPRAFPSYPCSNITSQESQSDMVVYFGDSVPKDTRGEYCFKTNAEPPYGTSS